MTPPGTMLPPRPPPRRWWVLLVVCLALMLSNGLTLAGITVFDPELLGALGVGRADLKARDLIQMLVAAAAAPLMGWLADRLGVRPLLVGGMALLGLGFLAYAHIGSIRQVYLVHVALGLALSACGLVLCVSVVSRWFSAERGLALGLVLAGGSLGNALLPQLNASLKAALGWRAALEAIGWLPLALIPLVLWLVAESPRDAATGAASDAAPEAAAAPAVDGGPPFAAALASRGFALLGLIAFCTFLSLVGITAHLFLFLKDGGFDERSAATGLTLLFGAGLVGKLAAGFAVDRLGLRRVFPVCLAAMCLGAALLLAVGSVGPWLAIGVLGTGWGGIYTLQQFAAAQLFAGPALGRIVGALVLIDSTGAAIGPWGIGRLFDAQGDYRGAFAAVLLLLLVALAAGLALRRLPALAHTEGAAR